MEAKERLKYIITKGSFKYAEIKTKFGENLCNFDCKSETQLTKELIDFVDSWGHQEYKFLFKTSQSNRNDLATVLMFDFNESKPNKENHPIQLQAQPMAAPQIDPKNLEEEILKRVRAEMKSQQLDERENEIKRRESELDTGAGKLNYVLNNHLLPHFMKNTPMPGQAPPPQVMLNGAESMPAFEYIDPRNNGAKILDTHAPEPQGKEREEYETALQILCEFVDSETLLLFARKIEKEPNIINTLKMML